MLKAPGFVSMLLCGLFLGGQVLSDSIELRWTAPGDDGYTGTAVRYDLRYSHTSIADSNWNQAIPIEGLPDPLPAGSQETIVVDVPDFSGVTCFAIKAIDDANNWSPISNIAFYSVCDGGCIGSRGNVDGDPNETVDISDLSYLISHLFLSPAGPPPPCLLEGNVDGDPDGEINVSDVTFLIEYMFGKPNGPAPPACP